MTREIKKIIIGAFTIAAFAVLFSFVSARSESVAEVSDGLYRVHALYNRVDGLLPGDEVRLSGIRVGYVESQALDANYRALLTFAIRSEVKLPLDTSAAIHTNGLFGSKFVVLEPGGEYDYIADGGEISYTQGSVVVEDLLELIISEGNANRNNQN